MRRSHLEALRPICPICRRDRGTLSRLAPTFIAREAAGDIEEGILGCPAPRCLREYPIVDGVPIIVANLRALLGEQALSIIRREDLSPHLESLLGDACGPGSRVDLDRQQVSAYAWDHFGDLDPAEAPSPLGESPGAVARVAAQACALAGPLPEGPLLDVGCAVGRGALELAARHPDRLVLGVDLHLAMLRLGSRALRRRSVRYDRRRVGIAYDRREFEMRLAGAERVDVWACDALALPFEDGAFALALALNVIDCVGSPVDLVRGIGRALSSEGRAVFTTPFDWSPAVTPVEAWLGGHSQRGPQGGAAEPALDALLRDPLSGLAPLAVATAPWTVRLHERSVMRYALHVAACGRSAGPAAPA